MKELPATRVQIAGDYWGPRLRTNAQTAIFHQWEQLEGSGCIDNFRLLSGEKDGFREGWFFADSDAYKWLDAAARVYASWPAERLKNLIDDFIALLGRAQAADGYLYTYNQLLFPEVRWTNLQIEHELYCHGHVIEAGVSHFQATGENSLLAIARRAADLLVGEFSRAGPEGTPGHQEIEIALLRVYQITNDQSYLALARHFIEQRGGSNTFNFARKLFQQNAAVARRGQSVAARRSAYAAQHPEYAQSRLPPGNQAKKPALVQARWQLNALSGKYFQQHAPVRRQKVPVGHAVRFAYLETALAMLQRHDPQAGFLPVLEQAWEHLVDRRMYVTGGIGALPALEGFGRDYELDPWFAYAETCAALASMFWNWEMALLTGQARYSDLFEWQLYNAAGVGMGLGGDTYLYNNPLACDGGVTRQPWYAVPCCPSNLSRTWADLGRYLYSYDANNLWLHQYVTSQAEIELGRGLQLRAQSALPWQGQVNLQLELAAPAEFNLHLRLPSWCDQYTVSINGERHNPSPRSPNPYPLSTAAGYDPRHARFLTIRHRWQAGDRVELDFHMPVELRTTHPRVKATRGQVAVTRGPLVYCLESTDHPGLDLFNLQLDPTHFESEFRPDMLGGTAILLGRTRQGEPLTFIPYHLWGNRGASEMSVYCHL